MIRLTCYVAVSIMALTVPALGPTAAAQATPAMSPTAAVSELLAGYNHKMSACKANHFNYAACPVTNRLRARLTKLNFQADPLCRCQVGTKHIAVSLISKSAKTARVKTVWASTMPATKPESITMVVIKPAHAMGWLVSGTYCSGKPSTSIYNPPRGACS